MDMARPTKLPSREQRIARKSTELARTKLPGIEPQAVHYRIAELLAAGHNPHQIGMRLAKGDKRRGNIIGTKIRHMLYQEDPRMLKAIGVVARAQLVAGLGPASEALAKRAGRGRPDAIKLLYETTGFHNPKVQHEHSGEISIKLDLPRPKFVDADAEPA